MGLTADDLQQQAASREEDEEANISANGSSCVDSSSSNNTEYGSEGQRDCSSPSDKHEQRSRGEISEYQQQQCRLLRKREGLLDITVRTVNLVRRNQQLQHRLAALQAETRAFVRSVLSNPENQALRELTSRSKRKSRNEDENDDSSSKRLKLDSITSTTTTTTTAATTDSATKLGQNPDVSESDDNQK